MVIPEAKGFPLSLSIDYSSSFLLSIISPGSLEKLTAFSAVMTGLPVSASISLRAFPAMRPPRLATFWVRQFWKSLWLLPPQAYSTPVPGWTCYPARAIAYADVVGSG
jgi:hypothetical protein